MPLPVRAGGIRNSLILHKAQTHIIYPLGSTIVIRSVADSSEQTFLRAHTQRVTCIALSRDGTKLASGQLTHMGYIAEVILWDLSGLEHGAKPQLLHSLSLHKGMVQAVAFSSQGTHLASIGGEDDNSLVIWSVQTGKPICGSPASHDTAATLTWLNCEDAGECTLVTGGVGHLRVWHFDRVHGKVRPSECSLGRERRTVQCLALSPCDRTIYCGTASGDVLAVGTVSLRTPSSSE